MQLPTPEDFGATGDGVTDDTAALQACFAAWPPSESLQSLAVAFTAGATYRITDTIQLAGPASHSRVIIQGNGGEIHWWGDDRPSLQLGDGVTRRGYRCALRDFSIRDRRPVATAAGGTFLISACDFSALDGVSVSCKGEAAIRVEWANSLTFRDVCTGGADIGVHFIKGPSHNVFRWSGGRVQQHRIGVDHCGTVFAIEQVDFSICSEWAVVSAGARGRLHIYTERLGSGKRGDRGGVVLLRNAKAIDIRGGINCANGAISSGTHAGYGVKCEASRHVTIRARGNCSGRAFVDADAECVDVHVLPGASHTNATLSDRAEPQPCPEDDPGRFHNGAAMYLDDFAPSMVDPIGEWTPRHNASVDGAEVSFPITNPWGSISAKFEEPEPRAAYRLEVRARLARFRLPEDERERGMAIMRLRLTCGETVNTYPRLGPGWCDYSIEITTPEDPGAMTVYLAVSTGWEPIDIETEFVRLVKA